jgi:tRNA(fMet)-specific endonuclease VapC
MPEYLFDTDAISEMFKPRPNARYLRWLRGVRSGDQLTSTVVIGELFAGAFRSRARERHVSNIVERVLPLLTVVPYDLAAAEAYGRIRAHLETAGTRIEDADLQIAATALSRGLTVVTGNLCHFSRVPGLSIEPVLAESRRG